MIDNCFHHHHHSAVVETLQIKLTTVSSLNLFKWDLLEVLDQIGILENSSPSSATPCKSSSYIISQSKLSFQYKRCRDWQNFTAHFVVVNLKVVLMYIQLWAGEVSDFKLAPQRPHDISMQSKIHRNLEMSLKYPFCSE